MKVGSRAVDYFAELSSASAPQSAARPPNTAMQFSTHANVNLVLDRLVRGIEEILGDRLIGVYLYGSLVSGDFDLNVSDLDLAVIMTEVLDDERFRRLHGLHQEIIAEHPEWEDRLELAYVSQRALNAFRHAASPIGIISPGEPFHLLDAGSDWVISWYMLRENGIPLRGPCIKSLIHPIDEAEYLHGVKAHIEAYRSTVNAIDSKSMMSYLILTTARGLYTLTMGKPVSKVQSARWAAKAFPQWAALIGRALQWREDPNADNLSVAEARRQARALVNDLLDKIPE